MGQNAAVVGGGWHAAQGADRAYRSGLWRVRRRAGAGRRRFLSWSRDITLRLWSADGTPLTVLAGHTDVVVGALALADGRFLSWAADKTLRLWSADGTPLTVLAGHTDVVVGALALADGRFLSWAADKTLRLWSADGTPLTVLAGHTDVVTGALALADGASCRGHRITRCGCGRRMARRSGCWPGIRIMSLARWRWLTGASCRGHGITRCGCGIPMQHSSSRSPAPESSAISPLRNGRRSGCPMRNQPVRNSRGSDWGGSGDASQ